MINAIQQEINNLNNKYILLTGHHKINLSEKDFSNKRLHSFNGVIKVNRPDLVIDGADATIEITLKNLTTNWSLFRIDQEACDVELRNLRVKVIIENPSDCDNHFAGIYNTAFGLKINNSQIELYSNKQINLYGVYNNGNLDTHMDTKADNLVIDNSTFKVNVFSESFVHYIVSCGIFNNLANSISVQNSFIYAVNKGNGDLQKAIGIYTNGRFGRFIGNNIKANGLHPEGLKLEECHVYGFINDGLFSIISNNNIVGEWAGVATALLNRGEYSIISGNKLLSTHTIYGKTIKTCSEKAFIENNIIISTSKNARLVVLRSSNTVISHNYMEVLLPLDDCISGCGVYAILKNIDKNIITENIFKNIKDCGMFVNYNIGFIGNNQFSLDDALEISNHDNFIISEKLNKQNIKSI